MHPAQVIAEYRVSFFSLSAAYLRGNFRAVDVSWNKASTCLS
jgi:hypothetical protein